MRGEKKNKGLKMGVSSTNSRRRIPFLSLSSSNPKLTASIRATAGTGTRSRPGAGPWRWPSSGARRRARPWLPRPRRPSTAAARRRRQTRPRPRRGAPGGGPRCSLGASRRRPPRREATHRPAASWRRRRRRPRWEGREGRRWEERRRRHRRRRRPLPELLLLPPRRGRASWFWTLLLLQQQEQERPQERPRRLRRCCRPERDGAMREPSFFLFPVSRRFLDGLKKVRWKKFLDVRRFSPVFLFLQNLSPLSLFFIRPPAPTADP